MRNSSSPLPRFQRTVVRYSGRGSRHIACSMRQSSSSNYITQIIVIARNAFREAVRDRILYNLVVFVLLLTGAAIFLSELTAGHEVRTIINLGLNAILLFGAFIAIFVGVGLVSKEIEKRTVYAIFAKPVTRSQFLVGKYLGLCLTLLVNTLVMGVGVTLALLYVGGADRMLSVWTAILFIFFELAVLTAVAITFSSFSTPALSALFSFFIFLIGHFSSSLRDLAAARLSERQDSFRGHLLSDAKSVLIQFQDPGRVWLASRSRFRRGGCRIYRCLRRDPPVDRQLHIQPSKLQVDPK